MPENKPQYKKLENALVANEFIKKEQYTGANIAFYEHVKPNLGEEAQKYVEATMGLDDPKIIKKLVEASYKDFMGNFEEQKIKDIFDYFKTLIGDSLEKEKVEKLKKYFDDFGKDKKLGDVLSKLNDLQKEFEMTKTSKERKEEIGKELENLAPFYQRYELLLGLKTDELSNPIREELKKKSLEQLTQGL